MTGVLATALWQGGNPFHSIWGKKSEADTPEKLGVCHGGWISPRLPSDPSSRRTGVMNCHQVPLSRDPDSGQGKHGVTILEFQRHVTQVVKQSWTMGVRSEGEVFVGRRRRTVE